MHLILFSAVDSTACQIKNTEHVRQKVLQTIKKLNYGMCN